MTNAHVGVNVPVEDLRKDFDAILLAGGAEAAARPESPGPRAEGHPLRHGVPAAAEQALRGRSRPDERRSWPPASTSSSSAAATPARTASAPRTARRRSRSHQFEIMPKPPDERAPHRRPGRSGRCSCAAKARTKKAACATGPSPPRSFTGDEHGNVKTAARRARRPAAEVRADSRARSSRSTPISCCSRWASPGPVQNGMIEQLGVKLDARGNVATDDDYMTSVPGVFAAGDMRRGQSLVVWAIAEGRKAARAIDLLSDGRDETYLASACLISASRRPMFGSSFSSASCWR